MGLRNFEQQVRTGIEPVGKRTMLVEQVDQLKSSPAFSAASAEAGET